MRYLPHTREEIQAMLQVVGADSLEGLFSTVPESCCCRLGLDLPEAMNEWELNAHMDGLSQSLAVSPEYKNYMGAGRYSHHIPAAATYLASRSEFLTSYTPYQPELSQGTLQAIYEFQTLATRLLGMEVATASHYDGATALAEALLMAVRIKKRQKVAVSSLIHPLYRQVVQTYFKPTGFEVVELPYTDEGATDLSALAEIEGLAAVAVQSPNFLGCIEDLQSIGQAIHEAGALFIAGFSEALAYGLLKSPGSLDADIVCGEGQSLGLSSSYGGPGLGIVASRKKFMRNLPGRLVGRTTDTKGRDGFVLTLATREQHIRREKATSNICTNNSHCALSAAIYMSLLGGSGIRELAAINHDKAAYLKSALAAAGLATPFSRPFFNEFVVKLPGDFNAVYDCLLAKKVIAGVPLAPYYPELAGHSLLCVTETAAKQDLDALVELLKPESSKEVSA